MEVFYSHGNVLDDWMDPNWRDPYVIVAEALLVPRTRQATFLNQRGRINEDLGSD